MEEYNKDIMNIRVPTHQEVDLDLPYLITINKIAEVTLDLPYLITTNKIVEVTLDLPLPLLPLPNHQRESTPQDRVHNHTLRLKMSIREEKK